jgi:hypothetical protein
LLKSVSFVFYIQLKMPPKKGGTLIGKLFAFLALALLICNTAAGLASRLAGSLALAASAVLCAVAQISGFQSLNMFHDVILH